MFLKMKKKKGKINLKVIMLKEMKRKLILKKLLTKENKYLLGYIQTFSPLAWTLGWLITGLYFVP